MAELGPHSRYRLAFLVRDEVNDLNYVLLRRKRLEFDPNAANRVYRGQSGDNVFSVAARYFRGRWPRPASLGWLLAEYQPTPILDLRKNLQGVDVFIPPDEKVAALLRTDETSG